MDQFNAKAAKNESGKEKTFAPLLLLHLCVEKFNFGKSVFLF